MGAELLKLRTVRTLLWLTLAEIGFVVIPAVSVAAASGQLTSAADDRSAARIAAGSLVFALISGIIIVASEQSHGTITQTFLVTPRRGRVIVAKAIVAAAIGLLLAVLAEAVTLAILIPGAGLRVGNVGLVLLGVLAGGALTGVLGAGLGALFRRQGQAIMVSLIWLLVGENIISLVQRAARFAPGHAFASLVSGQRSNGDVLDLSAGTLVSVLWAAGMLVLGSVALTRRDV